MKPPAGSLPESATTQPITKELLAAKGDIVRIKDELRNLEAKPWGPIPAKTAAQKALRAEHARLLAVLEGYQARVAALKAELGR